MKRNALNAPLLLLLLPLAGCAVEGSSDDTETAATESTLTASGGSIVKIDCPSKSGAANLVVTIDRAKSTATVASGDRPLAAVRPAFGIYSSADFSLAEHTGSLTSYSLKLDAQTTEVLRVTRTDVIKLAFDGDRASWLPKDTGKLTSIEVGHALSGGGWEDKVELKHLVDYEGASCTLARP